MSTTAPANVHQLAKSLPLGPEARLAALSRFAGVDLLAVYRARSAGTDSLGLLPARALMDQRTVIGRAMRLPGAGGLVPSWPAIARALAPNRSHTGAMGSAHRPITHPDRLPAWAQRLLLLIEASEAHRARVTERQAARDTDQETARAALAAVEAREAAQAANTAPTEPTAA